MQRFKHNLQPIRTYCFKQLLVEQLSKYACIKREKLKKRNLTISLSLFEWRCVWSKKDYCVLCIRKINWKMTKAFFFCRKPKLQKHFSSEWQNQIGSQQVDVKFTHVQRLFFSTKKIVFANFSLLKFNGNQINALKCENIRFFCTTVNLIILLFVILTPRWVCKICKW